MGKEGSLTLQLTSTFTVSSLGLFFSEAPEGDSIISLTWGPIRQ